MDGCGGYVVLLVTAVVGATRNAPKVEEKLKLQWKPVVM